MDFYNSAANYISQAYKAYKTAKPYYDLAKQKYNNYQQSKWPKSPSISTRQNAARRRGLFYAPKVYGGGYFDSSNTWGKMRRFGRFRNKKKLRRSFFSRLKFHK